MMTRTLRIALAAVALAALPLAAAEAQEPVDQRTYFTFSDTVELPGVTLEPGTYQFRLLEAFTFANRHVVQVLSEDGRRMLATLHTIPNQRREVAESPEVRFLETPEGQPSAVASWWYPGRTIGHEFIWPRERAVALARSAGRPVLTTGADTVWGDGLPADADLARVSPAGEAERVTADARPDPADVPGRAERGRLDEQRAGDTTDRDRAMSAPREQAPAVEQPRTTPQPGATAQQQPRRTLPATAGVLPLVVLLGLGSLAGAAGVRHLRRRS
jgi:hypothetical protein